jgi:3-vinyl bacteriochlorophyllide hydratase
LTLLHFAPLFAVWRLGGSVLSISTQIESEATFTIAAPSAAAKSSAPLYTAEQRKRRDESVWTLVQGLLAPIQFLVFGISLFLVIRFLTTGAGAQAAEISVLVKTVVLYTIMVTGSIWEKVVFDEWLFAKPFFWEDVFSMLVLALHTAYLLMLFNQWGSSHDRIYVALAAYATYVINAGQFLYKLRLARLDVRQAHMVAA